MAAMAAAACIFDPSKPYRITRIRDALANKDMRSCVRESEGNRNLTVLEETKVSFCMSFTLRDAPEAIEKQTRVFSPTVRERVRRRK